MYSRLITMRKTLIILFIILVLTPGIPCVASEPGLESSIDMGTFFIAQPRGDGWSVERDSENPVISFVRQKKWLGQIKQVTRLTAFQNTLREDAWNLTEENVANNFRNSEIQIMNDEGVAKKLYQLEAVEQGVETLEGKKLYWLRYRKTKMSGAPWGFREDGVLFLHFTPDFKDKHVFFGFLMSDFYQKGALSVKHEPELLLEMIKSFRPK